MSIESQLRARLGDAAPALLHVAGPIGWLDTPLLGVVGSRNVDEDGAAIARAVAGVAHGIGAGIVSGGAKGVDLLSMDAAYERAIPSVGVTAEGIERAGRRRELRAAVAEERLLLVSPFAPGAGFSVGSAMGRNKVIYGLAADTLVVASRSLAVDLRDWTDVFLVENTSRISHWVFLLGLLGLYLLGARRRRERVSTCIVPLVLLLLIVLGARPLSKVLLDLSSKMLEKVTGGAPASGTGCDLWTETAKSQ